MSPPPNPPTESSVPKPSDIPPRSSRFAVWALALASFGMALNANVLAALAPYLNDELGFDSRDIGHLASAAGWFGGLGALLLGTWVDRVGRRPPLLWGSVVFCVASVGYLLAADFWSLFAVRAATGFAAGIVFTSASAAVADLVPYKKRGAAMGILTASIFLAIPVGMPLAVALAERGLWRGIFGLQVVTAMVALGLMARALPRSPLPAAEVPGGERPSQWSVLREPMVIPALISVLLYTGAFFTTVQFVGKWLDGSGLLPRASQGWMWISLGLASAVGSAGLGKAVDAIGKRTFVLWTTAAVSILLLLLARVDSLSGLLLVGLPIAVLSASRSAALLALISNLVTEQHRGTLLGVRAAAVNLGMAAFVGLGGEVYEARGFGVMLWFAAAAVAVAYLCVRWFVRERHGD